MAILDALDYVKGEDVLFAALQLVKDLLAVGN